MTCRQDDYQRSWMFHCQFSCEWCLCLCAGVDLNVSPWLYYTKVRTGHCQADSLRVARSHVLRLNAAFLGSSVCLEVWPSSWATMHPGLDAGLHGPTFPRDETSKLELYCIHTHGQAQVVLCTVVNCQNRWVIFVPRKLTAAVEQVLRGSHTKLETTHISQPPHQPWG